MIFNICFSIRFIDTDVPDYARHLAFIIPLVGEFLTLLDLHVQIPEFEACGFSQLLIRDAQRKCRSSADLLKPYPSGPPARLLSFSFVTRERLLYSLLLTY